MPGQLRGYQNVINVVDENDGDDSMNSNFHSSTSSSSGGFNAANYLSNLGVQLNEEQLQYSSYLNTGMYLDNDRKRKRNTMLAYGVIGFILFWTFIHMITPDTPPKHMDAPTVTPNKSIINEAKTIEEPTSAPSRTENTDEKVDNEIENKSTWSTKPISEQIVHFSEVAENHFVQKMRNAKTDASVQPGCEATILITTACEKESFNSDNFFHTHCNYVGFERAQYFSTLFGSHVVTTDRRRKLKRNNNNNDDDNKGDDDDMDDNTDDSVKASGNNKTQAIEANELKKEEGDLMAESMFVAEEVSQLETMYLISQLSIKWPIPSFLYALAPQNRGNSRKHNYRELETITPLAKKFNLSIDDSYSYNTIKNNKEKLWGMEYLSSDLFTKMRKGDMCGKVAVIAWNHEYIPSLARYLGCGPMQGCPLEYNLLEYDDVWSIKYVYEPVKLPSIMLGEEDDTDSVENLTEKQIENEMGQVKGWEMFGTVVKQGFDPLRFSAEFGDYNVKGVDVSGNWMEATQ